jgi:hypothetical protein
MFIGTKPTGIEDKLDVFFIRRKLKHSNEELLEIFEENTITKVNVLLF